VSASSLIRDVLAISRAYSIGYISLAGLAAALMSPASLSRGAALLLVAIPVLLTIGASALNDVQHARADARAGRKRSYPLSLLLAIGLGGVGGAVLLGLWGGLGVLAGIGGTVFCGLLYGALKSQPGLGNIARGLTTVPLILGLGSLNQANWAALPLAVAVGVLDAAGNIYGDERDVFYDRQAGVRTLVVVAPRLATAAALGLHALAVLLLSWRLFATWPIWLSLAGVIYVRTRPPYWRHRAFLMVKYVTVGGVALVASVSMLEHAMTVMLLVQVVVAWWLYTHIHRTHEVHNASAS